MRGRTRGQLRSACAGRRSPVAGRRSPVACYYSYRNTTTTTTRTRSTTTTTSTLVFSWGFVGARRGQDRVTRGREAGYNGASYHIRLALIPLGFLLACATTSPAPPPPPTTTAAPAASLTTSAPRAIPSNIPFVSLEGPFWAAPGGYLIFSDVVEQNGAADTYQRTSRRSGAPGTSRCCRIRSCPPAPTGWRSTRRAGCWRASAGTARWPASRVASAAIADHAPAQGGPDPPSLNAPNDLTLRADGNIYFTDTKWGAKPGEHASTAVYRVAPDGTLSVAFRVDMPNGVVLSPDGNTLYVGSDAQDKLWRLPVAADDVGAPPLSSTAQSPGRQAARPRRPVRRRSRARLRHQQQRRRQRNPGVC